MARRNLNTKPKSKSKKSGPASPKPANAVAKLARRKKPDVSPVKRARKAAPPSLLNTPLAPNGNSSGQQRPKPETPALSAQASEQRGLEAQPSTYIDRGLALPGNYSLDRLVAMVRDPRCIYAYWELHGPLLSTLVERRGHGFIDSCAWVLRLHHISEGFAVDMEIDPSAGCWYLNVGGSDEYQVEIGLLSPDGEWISLLASQVVKTPRTGPSEVVDDEWGVVASTDEDTLLKAAFGLSESEPVGSSGPLGAARLQSSFALASSLMLGASASGRPVAGSWALSFHGASGRVSGSGSGGFGWMLSPSGAHEPLLERPVSQGSGPNWNAQPNLPVRNGRTQQPHFTVKLPRTLNGLSRPAPSWPPAATARKTPLVSRAAKALKIARA